ncbi:oxidoreductase-like domain-containing protein 1 [Dermacentor silvarum]|uniref:oxidoreductase-like domain-containing protein 1 n=1 Tax=Dermacentor silvarum TaxID=543639 RepID=UPI00189BDEB3|nr:oxidoreductase-like domain-containing protein 1 [Dermacentor silvarum]
MLKLATGVLLETVANSSHRATLSTVGLRPPPHPLAGSRHLSSDCGNDDPTTAKSNTTSEAIRPSEGSANGTAAEPPVPPGKDECCGSGCSNCVWLDYAEGLVEFYKDGEARAAEAVAKIPDPNVRQFVKTELDYLLKHKK